MFQNGWSDWARIPTEILSDAIRLCNTNNDTEIKDKSIAKTLETGTKYSAAQLDTLFNFDYKGSAGIKKSESGDIVLFSNTSVTKYQDSQTGDIINYHGQNTGTGKQKLIYGNKDLYNAYEDNGIKIHLFRNYIYSGEYTIKTEPYLDSDDKWVFPLSAK